MYNANITIVIKNIPTESQEETKKWLKEYFNDLAESNDGSEFLANLINNKSIDIDIYEQGELR